MEKTLLQHNKTKFFMSLFFCISLVSQFLTVGKASNSNFLNATGAYFSYLFWLFLLDVFCFHCTYVLKTFANVFLCLSKVLLFSQWTSILDIIEDALCDRDYKFCRIDGSVDLDRRQQQIEEFNREGSDLFLFLLTTRAGGQGINLTAADTVIIYDPDWNPQMDLQAQDRLVPCE